MNIRLTRDDGLIAFGAFGLSQTLLLTFGTPLPIPFIGVLEPYAYGVLVAALTLATCAIRNSQRSVPMKIVNFKRGEICLVDILKTEKTIMLSHFSGEPPNDTYISLLLGKLEDHVRIRRFLPAKLSPENEEWLRKFSNVPNYTETRTTLSEMPFDVFIFDDRKVYILFPDGNGSSCYTEGVEIESQEIAAMFSVAMRQLGRQHASRASAGTGQLVDRPLQPNENAVAPDSLVSN